MCAHFLNNLFPSLRPKEGALITVYIVKQHRRLYPVLRNLNLRPNVTLREPSFDHFVGLKYLY